ncbi:hypothetical protein IAT40_002646 [Kwoniella sp. CBS 6097]
MAQTGSSSAIPPNGVSRVKSPSNDSKQESRSVDSRPLDEETGQALRIFIKRLLKLKPSYVGIYQPGDFSQPTYRVVVPDCTTTKRGRGYKGMREQIVLETAQRKDIDILVKEVEQLVNSSFGPMAVRHILNPSHAKDEGIRLIWHEDGIAGYEEVQDWPRRARLIKEGKTVRSVTPEVELIGARIGMRDDPGMMAGAGLGSLGDDGQVVAPDYLGLGYNVVPFAMGPITAGWLTNEYYDDRYDGQVDM